MTDPGIDTDDGLLAAELALRLLEGEALHEARAREAAEPAFAAEVFAWHERLAGLFDEITAVEPGAGMWERVTAAIARLEPTGPGPTGNVVALQRRVGLWRAAAVGMTALAASLALVIGLEDTTRLRETKIVTRTVPVPTPVPMPVPAPLPAPPADPSPPESRELRVAALTPEDAPTMAVVSYDEDGPSLIFAPATLTPVAGHSHQLWVVPATGDPRSLGLVTAGAARRIALTGELEELFGGDATVAISAEREGGSRSGLPEGPIVAKGTLRPV